ncbi:Fc fragment of IgE, low affinity II, receptor for (CD23) [Chamberlinius hualienensis]
MMEMISNAIIALTLITINCAVTTNTVDNYNYKYDELNFYIGNDEINVRSKRFFKEKIPTIKLIYLKKFLFHVYQLLYILNPSLDLLPPPTYLSPIILKSYIIKLTAYINKLPFLKTVSTGKSLSYLTSASEIPFSTQSFTRRRVIITPRKTLQPLLPTTFDPCMNNFTKLGSQCYYFSSNKLSWHEAVKVCHHKTTDLAYPLNSKEIDNLRYHLKTKYRYIDDSWYLGGTDEQDENKWIWVHDKSPIVFTAWAKGQPNLQKLRDLMVKLLGFQQYKKVYGIGKEYLNLTTKEKDYLTDERLTKILQNITNKIDNSPLKLPKQAQNLTIKSLVKYLLTLLKQISRLKKFILEPLPPITISPLCPKVPGPSFIRLNFTTNVSKSSLMTASSLQLTSATSTTRYRPLPYPAPNPLSPGDYPPRRLKLEGSVHQPPTSKPSPCRTNFVQLGSHCYFFSSETINWYQAREDCKGRAANLAHPMNKKENDYIVDYIITKYIDIEDSWFIGGTDEYKEGQWIWIHDKTAIVFNAWGKDQPRNFNSIKKDFGNNTNVVNFILKTTKNSFSDNKTNTSVNPNLKNKLCTSPTTLSPCSPGFVLLGIHCYFFSTAAATWHNAIKSCRDKDSHLAFPMNEQEQLNLQLALSKRRKYKEKHNFWIGGNEEKQGEWRWFHNKIPIKFANWAENQPDNVHGNEHCLLMVETANFKWNDFNCDKTAQFICQSSKIA